MQVELLDKYAKSYIMMEQLLPVSARAMDGVQSGKLLDPTASTSLAIGFLAKSLQHRSTTRRGR